LNHASIVEDFCASDRARAELSSGVQKFRCQSLTMEFDRLAVTSMCLLFCLKAK